ncbi:hypothetical protein GCM10010195_28860 [Kitasatospora griseola]|nr:hypothetical protein GCM10010195_28860 [Kitasatospora griseola]
MCPSPAGGVAAVAEPFLVGAVPAAIRAVDNGAESMPGIPGRNSARFGKSGGLDPMFLIFCADFGRTELPGGVSAGDREPHPG